VHKFDGAAPLRPKCSLLKESTWVVYINAYNFFVSGSKFNNFVGPTGKGIS